MENSDQNCPANRADAKGRLRKSVRPEQPETYRGENEYREYDSRSDAA
jgi:hypothetical protein